MIEGHGDDLYRYGAKVMHNFSTNIISDSDHSGLISYLHSVMSKIGSYPEPAPYSLERQIARKIVSERKMWLSQTERQTRCIESRIFSADVCRRSAYPHSGSIRMPAVVSDMRYVS